MDANLRSFERDMNALRELVIDSGYEEDPYRIIILIERYILKYGTAITRDTTNFLLSKNVSVEERQIVLLDVLQTQKTPEQLYIYNYEKDSI